MTPMDNWISVETKQFPVIRCCNGRGYSNLLAIINEAIPDISIGDAIVVPGVSGGQDPTHVILKVDGKGNPLRDNNIAIVNKYIYP